MLCFYPAHTYYSTEGGGLEKNWLQRGRLERQTIDDLVIYDVHPSYISGVGRCSGIELIESVFVRVCRRRAGQNHNI